jgi:prevent-host-death family protein
MATTLNPLPKIVSALSARTQFGQIMRRARSENTRFVVDRRGEPQVVIVGVKDSFKTISPEKKMVAAIRAASRKQGTNKLSLREINREIRAYRRERSIYFHELCGMRTIRVVLDTNVIVSAHLNSEGYERHVLTSVLRC